MIPLSDEIQATRTPYVNWLLIGSCILVFLWQFSGGAVHLRRTVTMYGLVPARVLSGSGLHTFLSNIFLHGGWMHLVGNMLFLHIFGDNVEGAYGHLRYLAFYIICGFTASAIWMLTAWGSPYPAVGASGAISGVMGAYVIMFPKSRIRALVSFGFLLQVRRVPAYFMIGLWFVYQLLLALLPMETGVAYWAHVGGFAVGIACARFFKPRREPRSPFLFSSNYW